MARHTIAIGRCLFALCCILPCVAVSPALADLLPTVPSGYGLNWGDEFNGTSLNMNTWSVHNGGNSYSVGGGNLKLSVWTDVGGIDHFGYIDTENSYQQTYGYFVARAKFNEKSGTCSAFWVYSPDRAHGATEMDIVEHRQTDGVGHDLSNRTLTTVHWGPWESPSKAFIDYSGINVGDGNYHLFAMKWTPTAYTFYVDNTPYWTFNQAISQRPEYLFLDCIITDWVGPRPTGGYGPQGSPLNAAMTVDYVRVYAIPEPGALVLLTTGLLGLLVYYWRTRK
jgi:hypothetical protein